MLDAASCISGSGGAATSCGENGLTWLGAASTNYGTACVASTNYGTACVATSTSKTLDKPPMPMAGHLPFNDLDSFTTIPTNPGPPLSTLNYIIVIRLGTPEKTLQMVFDTGSHLTWTQCYQCKSCYEQANARFNPLNSSTYEASDCLDDTCEDLISSGQGKQSSI